MCKAICGVAAGACNGAINLHWAKGSDISDINAKFGAQHTVTGGLGIIFVALYVTSVLTISSHALWFLYFTLTIVHIYANIKCMKLLAFHYLITEQMVMITENFLDRIRRGEDSESIIVYCPQTVSSQASLVLGLKQRLLTI